jgi:nitrogen fixation protein FixH
MLKGRHVLLTLIGFFAVIFAVNGIMVYKAESTFGGLDTDDPYRKGLDYNERIAAAEAQAKLGWRDSLSYVPETRRLRVSLIDKAGGAISGLEVSAQIQRPATNRFDREIVLEQTGPGIYEAEAAGLGPGGWTVDLTARSSDEDAALYEARRRLWIKP